MTIVTTTLFDAAQGLADTLELAASEMLWDPTVCVTPVEPAFDCERIHVWFAGINPEQNKCHIASQVDLRWAISHCIGADDRESCAWWEEEGRTDEALGRLWGIYGGLLAAYTDGTLCTAMDVSACSKVRIGRVDRIDSADFVVYSGLVTVQLDVTPTGS